MLIQTLFDGGLELVAAAICLVILTVTIHAVGFAALLRAMVWSRTIDASGFWRVTVTTIGLTCWLMVIHLLEISVWALFYLWQGCLPDGESAVYFPGVTYTTVGYGDLVLPRQWRMLGALEAMTGILMAGLSTVLFFAVISRWIKGWVKSIRH